MAPGNLAPPQERGEDAGRDGDRIVPQSLPAVGGATLWVGDPRDLLVSAT